MILRRASKLVDPFGPGSSEPRPESVIRILCPRVTIGRDWLPKKPTGVTPAIQHDARAERLPAGGDDDAVMFSESSRARNAPAEYEGAKLKAGQLIAKIARPFVAEAALFHARVHEEVVKLRRTYRAKFSPKPARDSVGQFC